MIKLRTVLIYSSYLLAVAGCWKTYVYFFDSAAPQIVVSGIAEQGVYKGANPYSIAANKKGYAYLFIDEKPWGTHKISKNKPLNLCLDASKLSNGPHNLRVAVIDSTYHHNTCQQKINFSVDQTPLLVSVIPDPAENKVLQGRTHHLQFSVNKPIQSATATIFGHSYSCIAQNKGSLTYEAFIPVACEEMAGTYPLNLTVVDQASNKIELANNLEVIACQFKREALKVDTAKIAQEESLGSDARTRERMLAKIIETSPQEKLWRGPFCTPIDIVRTSCEFGTIRTTQHKGRYAHKALDVTNTPKSVVWAPQDGIVVLKERFADSGNVIAIDHGCGIISMFYHLDDFAKLEVGDKLAKGNPIGTIGKTGYTTGYHLHWEMRVNNVPVDPMQWTSAIF